MRLRIPQIATRIPPERPLKKAHSKRSLKCWMIRTQVHSLAPIIAAAAAAAIKLGEREREKKKKKKIVPPPLVLPGRTSTFFVDMYIFFLSLNRKSTRNLLYSFNNDLYFCYFLPFDFFILISLILSCAFKSLFLK